MIIDFHTHMFPDKIAKGTLDFLESVCKTHPYTDGTSEGLKASTEEAGIDISVALPIVTKLSQFASIIPTIRRSGSMISAASGWWTMHPSLA